jgi:DNA-directed RNA polymerase specialized sigma24 family protein
MPRGPGRPTELAGRLYDYYGASLYRYALMLLADRAAAEDAVHQVFASLVALLARDGTVLDNAEHYLRRAVRNECYSVLRRATRDPGGVLLKRADKYVVYSVGMNRVDDGGDRSVLRDEKRQTTAATALEPTAPSRVETYETLDISTSTTFWIVMYDGLNLTE